MNGIEPTHLDIECLNYDIDTPVGEVNTPDFALRSPALPTMNTVDAVLKKSATEYALLPEATCVQDFLERPTELRPKSEFFCMWFNEDDTLLTHVVKNQNIGAVAALVRAGLDTNTKNGKGIYPISAAAHKGNITVMQLLIDGGALANNANLTGSTALIQVSYLSQLSYLSHFSSLSSLISRTRLISYW